MHAYMCNARAPNLFLHISNCLLEKLTKQYLQNIRFVINDVFESKNLFLVIVFKLTNPLFLFKILHVFKL